MNDGDRTHGQRTEDGGPVIDASVVDAAAPVAAGAADDLDDVRTSIDELDARIVELLNRRASLALEAGRSKANAGRDEVRDADREREVLLRVAMANRGPLPQADLLVIYRTLIDALVALEEHDRAGRP